MKPDIRNQRHRPQLGASPDHLRPGPSRPVAAGHVNPPDHAETANPGTGNIARPDEISRHNLRPGNSPLWFGQPVTERAGMETGGTLTARLREYPGSASDYGR